MIIRSLGLVFIFACHAAFAQEEIFEFSEPGLNPDDFELMCDNDGTLVIHYTKVLSSSPRVVKSTFIFHSPSGTKEFSLPIGVDVQYYYSTDIHFIFLVKPIRSRNVGSKWNVIRTDKEGNQVAGTPQLDFDGEGNGRLISKGPYCYMVSGLGDGEILRLRNLSNPNIETFDLPISLSQFDSWGKGAFPKTFSEYLSFRGKNPVFIRNYYKESFGKVENRMILHEIDLTGTPILKDLEGPGIPDGYMDFAIFEDKLFYFQATKAKSQFHVLDLESLATLRSFSSDDDADLLDGEFFEDTGLKTLKHKPYTGETIEKKLKFLSDGFPYIDVQYSGPGKVGIKFGSYRRIYKQ